MSDPVVRREDVEAALEARKELGRAYEPEIVDAFVERIERRVEERLKEARPREPHRIDLRLPLGSFALGVGATAVATSDAHGVGGIVIAIVAWIAIAVVNVVVIALTTASSWFRR
jgi:hypothetical protein